MFALRNASTLIRSVAGNSIRSKVTLPKLPYDYNALEPIICREIMELHHQSHHRAYVNNLNRIEEKLHLAIIRQDTKNIVALNAAFKFNAGGHINHSIFWQNLSPSYSKPSSELNLVIKQQFGSLDNIQKELAALACSLRGSGWAWLGYNKNTGMLHLATCANQDPLEATTGLTPLFGIDVWEHAYYLQYKSMKQVYAKSIFEIANWDDISERFAKVRLSPQREMIKI